MTDTIRDTGTDRRSETRTLLMIALPLSAAYLAEFAMFQTTKIVVGSLGYENLAAAGIAGAIAFDILMILMGVLSIVGVLVAQAVGAGRDREAGLAARQGFLVATVIGLAATVLIWNLDTILALVGQDPQVVALAKPYLVGLAGCALPTLWFAVLRNFVTALARTGAIMAITVAAVGLNFGLTVILVHGSSWTPAFGLLGAGLATTLVSWAMVIALFTYAYRNAQFRGYGLFRGRLRFDKTFSLEILRLGLPVAGLVTLESGLFIGVAILSGVIGVKALATYEIISSWIGVPFVIALGLAEATMVRVAFHGGRGRPDLGRRSGFVGIGLGIAILAALVVVPLTFSDLIVGLFIEADDPGYPAIIELARHLFFIAALFQVFDGIQAIASRALRGVKDTIAPLWIAAFGYWVLGLGGGALLAFPLGLAASGLWWGLALGLMVTGLLLVWRFQALTRAPKSQTEP